MYKVKIFLTLILLYFQIQESKADLQPPGISYQNKPEKKESSSIVSDSVPKKTTQIPATQKKQKPAQQKPAQQKPAPQKPAPQQKQKNQEMQFNKNPEAKQQLPKKTYEIEQIKEDVQVISRTPDIPSFEGEFGFWTLFQVEKKESGKKVCYIVNYPFDKTGNHKFIRKPYIIIIFEKRRSSVVLTSGYEFARQSKVNISINKQQHSLEAQDFFAIPKDPIKNQAIMQDIFKGSSIIVYSRSITGSYSVDTYSLKGFSEAYEKMFEICTK